MTITAGIMVELTPTQLVDTLRQVVRDELQKIRNAYKSTGTPPYIPFVEYTSEVFTHLSKKMETMFTDDVFNEKMLLLEKIFNSRNFALNQAIAALAAVEKPVVAP